MKLIDDSRRISEANTAQHGVMNAVENMIVGTSEGGCNLKEKIFQKIVVEGLWKRMILVSEELDLALETK